MLGRIGLVVALLVIVGACSSADGGTTPSTPTTSAPLPTGDAIPTATISPSTGAELVDSQGNPIGEAPPVPEGPVDPTARDALDRLWDSLETDVDIGALLEVRAAGDARLAWHMSDLLRFFQSGNIGEAIVSAFNQLTGSNVVIDGVNSPWKAATDRLFAWDIPAPPGYVDDKGDLFTLVGPGWQQFFDDPDSDIDWRFVSWGGVRIDDRPLGDPNACPLGCIPALDDPAVTDAAGGDWYPDERVVFAVVINGDARAYPKHIMEVHEMVNDTLGGRRIGMPYCTLCGSAQAYFTDAVPDGVETPVLRTSGLLARSNKVMYDLITGSAFDTFLGSALSGPLREADVMLEPVTVVTTTWGEWKAAHPETTIVAEDGGIGRSYDLNPLRGRDDNGPIFPVGDVDPRLPVQEQVLGVVTPAGQAVAFAADAARTALEGGATVSLEGIELLLDGGGLRATTTAGIDLSTHQAFWFAWSQFRPDTLVWENG